MQSIDHYPVQAGCVVLAALLELEGLGVAGAPPGRPRGVPHQVSCVALHIPPLSSKSLKIHCHDYYN